MYYPGVTNPLYNTIPTWKCSTITTHVCRAGDGSMITDFCYDRRRTFTKYLCSYLKQIVCCTLRLSTSLASSYEGSWNVHNSMLTKSYTNMRTVFTQHQLISVFTLHLFLNRYSHISISYLYVPNLQYFAT